MDCALTSIITKGNDRKLEVEVKLKRKKRILEKKNEKKYQMAETDCA